MPSKKKRKEIKTSAPQAQKTKPAVVKKPVNLFRLSLIVTSVFFLAALFGMLHHEMWRDEHQAWLVARDANSIGDVFKNMKYEGNPALWHMLLFVITRFTHDPIAMQILHLLIACGFIFVFNRYAPLPVFYKVLFSFGYFPLYEYAVISRSYGLGILLAFVICALYKYRTSRYILMGVLLALLANVSIYTLIISIGIVGILALDYLFYQAKNKKKSLQLAGCIAIAIIGIIFSLYQIWPSHDNTFPVDYATKALEPSRWGFASSKLFTTYFYVPNVDSSFWNTNIYLDNQFSFGDLTYKEWLHENPAYLWGWVYLPVLIFITGILIFLRKPMILLLYFGLTVALLSLYYYTLMVHSRYCGHLLIALMICYWLAGYYPEKKYSNKLLNLFSRLGKMISIPFLGLVLIFNVAGAVVALSMDHNYEFSRSKDAADFIKKNKLDTLTITGTTDFVLSSLSSYLDKKIYYPQMGRYGSFTEWSSRRNNNLTFSQLCDSVDSLMKDKTKLLLVMSSPPQLTKDGTNYYTVEKGMIAKDIKIDLQATFTGAIVENERYYIYLAQKVNPLQIDPAIYPYIK